jgi:glycosyltransferase involved in cell wall biosynthesis
VRTALIAKPGAVRTGVGRYVQMLESGLREAGVDVLRVAPVVPPLPGASYAVLRRLGADLPAFFSTYPVWARHPAADVYHLTSQNLASLLLFRPPRGTVVVTVHDVIPHLLRRTPALTPSRTVADRLFDRLAMAGLGRAARLIADSHFTKDCLVRHLGLAPETIAVVHLGIDREHFRPRPVPDAARARYGLPAGWRYLIYVGSEDPRKDLATLLRALAEVRRRHPDVHLVKVGRAHFEAERRRLIRLADGLGIRAAVHFLDDVPEHDLPILYSLAHVCVMPSRYEGFGLPVLEAMACGTPVVCARATSLPELAGEAGLCFRPGSSSGLAAAVGRLLERPGLYDGLRARGLARAGGFGWDLTVGRTLSVLRAEPG